MVIDLTIEKSFDGLNVKIPNFPECDFWVKTEDEAIKKAIEVIQQNFLIEEKKIKFDRARVEDENIIYKIFVPDYSKKL
jgi:predicted RNase H-like HicB family nuclease